VDSHQAHRPAEWEKITTALVAVAIVALVGFLIIRNEPVADPNLAVATRILLSLASASLGATIPGFLMSVGPLRVLG
jgi:hypothetical protein